MNLLTPAKKYIKSGISIVPTDDNKRSIVPWKKYQSELASEEEINQHYNDPKAKGIAVICGQVSGNLEVIDIDTKYDITGTLYQEYTSAIAEHDAALLDKLLIIQTKSGGYHFYFRCESIEGNQKLAQRHCTDEEKKSNPNVKVQVLIETRGEGGYVVAPPTEGYKTMQGKNIPVISLDEREMLLELARSFNQVFAEPQRQSQPIGDQNKYSTSPFEDFNARGDAEMILLNNGWTFIYERSGKRYYRRPGKTEGISGDYWVDKKWFSVFTTSSEFEAGKAYNPASVFCLLEANNDWKKCYQELIDRNYGLKKVEYGAIEREVFKRKADGQTKEEIKTFLVRKMDVDVKNVDEVVDTIESQWGPEIGTFWDIDAKQNIHISRYKLKKFLCSIGGFGLYFYDANSTIFKLIRDNNGIIEEASTEQIKKFIEDHIYKLPDVFDGGVTQQELLEVIYKGSETYFSKGFFEFLDRRELDFIRDTIDTAYIPFRNGVVVVNKTEIVLSTYSALKKCIWKSQIVDADFQVLKTFETSTSEFSSFIHNVCNKDDERTAQAFSLIGYLLHNFKDTSRPYAVIIAEENEDEKKGGGTGKGIFVRGIKEITNTQTMDGKNFKFDKSFAFQRVDLDTKVIAIEDVRKNVDFEGFYSIITEGITVEKKNKDELYIPYKDSPKILITTNYTIPSTGNHAKRRQRVIEFSNHYHPAHTPIDEFGHRLFDDWDRDEYNRYYNLMVWCIQSYMIWGVKDIATSSTVLRKHIKLNFGEEFMEWFDDYSANGCAEWKLFKDQYNGFLGQNDMEKKDYSQKRFKKGLEEACEKMGFTLETKRGSQSRQIEIRALCT